ncbi:MAG: NHLP family bacteriocin export ABC transporter permease/ATPase subunit, partial [Clostridia bacterium]|nr:NHLP family bacteriocin export ABC transporter permease/ATPase subunit [Clostridia bacterium]
MSWFDEQIRQRNKSDQSQFEDAIFAMASVVWGRSRASAFADRQTLTKAAMDEIVKYFHFKPRDIPDSVTDPEDQLEYCMRPFGIMHRNVRLTGNWYKDAYGPMLARRTDNDTWVALLPGAVQGYTYLDQESGKAIRIDRGNVKLFKPDAICFYKPLPQKAIGIPQLIMYMKDCFSLSDLLHLVIVTLVLTMAGMLLPHITYLLTSLVYRSGSIPLLFHTAVFVVITVVVQQVISIIRSLTMNRIETKTRLSVEAAIMMRLLSLPATFFRKYSSGELSSRMQSVNSLCNVILGSGVSVGLTSLMSLMYIRQFFTFAPVLSVPALLIVLTTIAISTVSSILQVRITRDLMENEAAESGMTFSMINGMSKIKLAGAEKRFFARWAKTYAKSANLRYNPPVFLKANAVIISAVSLAGTIVLYYLAVSSGVEPARYMAFNASYAIVMGAFSDLSRVA